MTETLVIQSDIANMPQVEELLFHFCRECNIGSYYSTVSVATLQAVENAILHGNGSDESKKVGLTMGTCRGGVYVEVTDEGNGFDYSRYGSLPTGNQSTGEGIFIMNQLSDKMTFCDDGRKVRLEFIVNGIDPVDALERVAVLREHYSLVAA